MLSPKYIYYAMLTVQAMATVSDSGVRKFEILFGLVNKTKLLPRCRRCGSTIMTTFATKLIRLIPLFLLGPSWYTVDVEEHSSLTIKAKFPCTPDDCPATLSYSDPDILSNVTEIPLALTSVEDDSLSCLFVTSFSLAELPT